MKKKELKDLVSACFAIECTLPLFNTFGYTENTAAQELRRQLYIIRCEIGKLQAYYADIEEKTNEL